MDERPSPPPEGRLISDALARKGLSIREASKRAGISYGRWRQIASGYQSLSPGSYAPVHAPALTLARMAAVVEVAPAQLERAGRPDAAEILAAVERGEDLLQADDQADDLGPLTAEEMQIVRTYRQAIREGLARVAAQEQGQGHRNGATA